MLRRNSDDLHHDRTSDWSARENMIERTYLKTSFELPLHRIRRRQVGAAREVIETGHWVLVMARMCSSPADHGKQRRRGRARRRHVNVGELDGLVWRRGGSRRGTSVVPWKGNDVLEARTFGGMKFTFIHLHRLSTFLVRLRPPVPILRALRTIHVVWVRELVFRLLLLGQILPEFALVRCQALPLLADRFRKIGLPLLLGWTLQCRSLVLRLLTIFAALTSEEDKCVFGALDVVLVAFLRPAFDDVTTA